MIIDDRIISGILFDYDNTIVATAWIYRKHGLKALQELSIDISLDESVERWPAFMGRSVDAELAAEGLIEPGDLLNRMKGVFDAPISEEFVLPGVRDFLDVVDGMPKAIVSDGVTARVERQLADVGLLSHFDVVLGSDKLKSKKPDPNVYWKGAEAIGVKIQECLVLDDIAEGVNAGIEAGAATVWVKNGLLTSSGKVKWAPFRTLSNIADLIYY